MKHLAVVAALAALAFAGCVDTSPGSNTAVGSLQAALEDKHLVVECVVASEVEDKGNNVVYAQTYVHFTDCSYELADGALDLALFEEAIKRSEACPDYCPQFWVDAYQPGNNEPVTWDVSQRGLASDEAPSSVHYWNTRVDEKREVKVTWHVPIEDSGKYSLLFHKEAYKVCRAWTKITCVEANASESVYDVYVAPNGKVYR